MQHVIPAKAGIQEMLLTGSGSGRTDNLVRKTAAVVTTILLLLMSAGCSHRSGNAKQSISIVDGTISEAKVSPDCSRIAVFWSNERRDSGVLILDPVKRSILGKVEDTNLWHAQWSPDSRWIASFDGPKDILLIGRNGEKRVVRTSHRVMSLAWQPSGSEKIYYSSNQDGSGIFEINLAKGSERRIDFGHSIINLFSSGGKICVAYFKLKGAANGYFNTSPRDIPQDEVLVADLQNEEIIYKVPLEGETPWGYRYSWNDYWIETSPDGKYFYIHGSANSGGGMNVIARVEDAGSVFASRKKAVIFSQDTEDDEMSYRITWTDKDTAVVDGGDLGGPVYVDLATKRQTEVLLRADILDWWHPKTGRAGFILAAKDGLSIPGQDAQSGELVLRHNLIKQQE